jgi:iron-sulfur cluster assembly accessory protein
MTEVVSNYVPWGSGLPEITLTDAAAQAFKDSCLAEEKSLEGSFLRVSAHSGGCSGYKYDLEWDSPQDVKPSDVQFESQGVHIIVDKTCLVEILGPLQIDYSTVNLVEQGFVFKQLLKGHQCGCGESFTPVKDL